MTPTTAAGRARARIAREHRERVLTRLLYYATKAPANEAEAENWVRRIETEARAAALDEAITLVEALPFRRMTGGGLDEGGTTGDLAWDWDEWDDVIARSAVLEALRGKR